MRPHRFRYWLNSPDDPVEFAERSRIVCDIYKQTPRLNEEGVHVVSVDEKTGIQALERIAPEKPMQPGREARIEFEYCRHGTTCLIANFMVATGLVIASTLAPHRDEVTFAAHIKQTISNDSSAGWIFVCDQLNTHMSESLVRLVARHCGIDEATLGEKGRSGILGRMKTRQEFLESADHRIRFVYTPRHASWLNQVEIWFGVLVRRLLKRSSFVGVAELEERIRSFIAYFNHTLARPYRWTYEGKPLKA